MKNENIISFEQQVMNKIVDFDFRKYNRDRISYETFGYDVRRNLIYYETDNHKFWREFDENGMLLCTKTLMICEDHNIEFWNVHDKQGNIIDKQIQYLKQ